MAYTQSGSHIPLSVDGTPLENYFDSKDIAYYKVRIGNDYNRMDDLVLTVKPTDSKSDPDLFVSLSNQNPSDLSTSDFICAMVGEDICTIPASDLRPGSTLYVGAKCYRKCSYEISASLEPEFEVKPRKDYKFNVSPDHPKIVAFKNTGTDVKDLVFSARTSRTEARMSMYLSEGVDSAPSSDSMSAQQSWENGLVVRLTNSSSVKVVNDEYYKLLIESDIAITVDFRVDMVYSEKLLEEGVAFEDFVNYNDRTCYKYIVRNAEQKLRIGAYSFSGNPDIYVNPGNVPESYEDFAFKATETSDDVIVLTPEDRSKVGHKKGMYYICVRGNSNTSYRIRVVESDKEYFLEDGIAETNEIHTGKEHTFYYTDESLSRDLNLTFTLAVKSGPRPRMLVKFCGRVPEDQCIIGNDQEAGLVEASAEIGKLFAFVPHFGKQCKKATENQTLPCIYAIEVQAPTRYKDDVTNFSILAHHNETSHIQLREGISIEQVVQNHEQRFYSFISRDASIEEITFTVNSHHGDADLYVSSTHKYPDAKSFDFKSDRSRRFADEVTIISEQGKNLLGVYYVGVQGFEYSSYNVRVSVKRKDDQLSQIVPTELSEGISLADHINDTDSKKYYQFKTYMFGEAISDIKISLTEYIGSAKFYVKQGSIPTETDYDFYSETGQDLIMRSTDSNFSPTGIKYIMVMPITKYGSSKKIVRYTIEWSTKKTISEIKNNIPSFDSVQFGHYNTYKYLSIQKGDDLTISLTPLSGDPNLIVSITPTMANPTIENNDFHSKKEGSDSVNIRGSDMSKKNPSCQSNSPMLIGGKPCEVFIAVYCADRSGDGSTTDACAYSLKVYNGNEYLHLLVDGSPQKDAVMEGYNQYYYVNLDAGEDYLYVAASAIKGDISVYVDFFDHDTREVDMIFPDTENKAKSSKHVGHSQMIHFTKNEVLNECEGFTRNCMAVISIKGREPVEDNQYSLVAYTHVPRLVPNVAMIGKTSDETIAYYSYTSYCEKCAIIVSASAYSIDADIDLFINVGADKELPTLDKHNIESTNWFSEVVYIDQSHEYFVEKGMTSMQQVFIIGVYAKDETTFSIEIEESSSEVKTLKSGHGVQVDQDPNNMRYFAYVHNDHTNLKFELTMLSGIVQMRINKYQDFENYEPEFKFLPQDERSSIWSTNSNQNSTILISEEDKDFCQNCVYLIGIHSNENGAKYILEVQTEEVMSNKQIRMGVPIKDQIDEDDYKQYMFVLDRKADFRVNLSIYMGKVSYSIGNERDFKKAVRSTTDSSMNIHDGYLDKFEDGENVYIKIKGEFDHSEFILVVTHMDSYSILPDSFGQEMTINPHDESGINLLYYPPAVQHKLKMQINSFSEGVVYDVLLKKEFLKNIGENRLEFPLQREGKYKVGSWNKDRLMLSETHRENPEQSDEFVYLISIFPKVTAQDLLTDNEKVNFNVLFSSQDVNYMLPNTEIEDYLLADKSQSKYYKFFANGDIDLEIVLTPCVCDSDVFIYKTLDDAMEKKKVVDRTRQMINGEKKIRLRNASGPYYLRVDITKKVDPNYIKPTDECVFTIKSVDRNSATYKYTLEDYVAGNEGKIDYELKDGRKVKMTWDTLYKETPSGNKEVSSINSLFFLKNPNVFMNSVCGINHAVKRKDAYLIANNFEKDRRTVDWAKNKKLKKLDVGTFALFAYVNREGAAIPYQTITVDSRKGILSRIPWIAYFIFALILGGLVGAVYHFKKKAKAAQSKLDFEMNDIRNVARVGFPDDEIERQNINS